MPFTADPKLRIGVLAFLRGKTGCRLRPVFASKTKGIEEEGHVLLGGQTVDHITGPPVHRVPCGHQTLVVLHEFPVADHQFSVVPNLFDSVAERGVRCGVINAQESPVLQDHPRTLGFVARRDGARFSGTLNFHLRSNGDEIIQG